MEEPERDETQTLDPDEGGSETPRDDRATQPTEGSPEPEPGEDAGPMGNPAQDEEALEQQQQDGAEGADG